MRSNINKDTNLNDLIGREVICLSNGRIGNVRQSPGPGRILVAQQGTGKEYNYTIDELYLVPCSEKELNAEKEALAQEIAEADAKIDFLKENKKKVFKTQEYTIHNLKKLAKDDEKKFEVELTQLLLK